MQSEIPTIETRSRRERESKKREVRHLLEDLYRMEPNTVGKIIDTFFEHDFLPNWYFHSNRAEDVASDLFIVSQLLSAKDEYLTHTSLDGKKITYFSRAGGLRRERPQHDQGRENSPPARCDRPV